MAYDPLAPVPLDQNLADLASARLEAGTKSGLDPQPWRDPSRQFIRVEAAPEFADADNYLACDAAQAEAAGESSGEYRTAVALARDHCRTAFIYAMYAAGIRERNRALRADNFEEADHADAGTD